MGTKPVAKSALKKKKMQSEAWLKKCLQED
jgi:hypothetical protein